jgi:hypothetical protein
MLNLTVKTPTEIMPKIGIIIGGSFVFWGIVGLIYLSKRPDTIKGMTVKRFKLWCWGMIIFGVVIFIGQWFAPK